MKSSVEVTNAVPSIPGIIPPAKAPLRNLKTPGHAASSDDAILQSWNELKGLSEKELLTKNTGIVNRDSRALALAYRRCEYVTELFSKTFYMGTSLMQPEARQHVWAIYAWCRRTDDIVDSPRALLNREVLQSDLQDWGVRLDEIWSGKPRDLFDLAMADTVRAFPSLPIQPFQDMIAGMIMDIPGLGQERYQTFDELYLYCYRVAGTVGLMTLPILGTAEGYTEAQATEPALALGIALQLTNILRDVGEDLERGRIYLPMEEITFFGLTEDDLFRCEVTPQYREFMKFQIKRARDYYAQAARGIPMLAPSGRLAVQASLDLYSKILDVIERNGYDNFNKRAFTTKLEKLAVLPGAYYKSIVFEQ
ncbi:isoprenoid synthase domain-containing protein [Ochromonadaceae sp. CCMP2298]|nr:isoprenoid synthase domain-containing protein [Ochromonadaceae sp. CCMP2298]